MGGDLRFEISGFQMAGTTRPTCYIMTKKKRVILIISALIFIVILYGVYSFLRLAFEGSTYCDRDDFIFPFVIDSDVIKNCPKTGLIGKERYCNWSDPHPIKQGVSFDSQALKEDIINSIETYLKNLGYQKNSARSGTGYYQYELIRDNEEYTVIFELDSDDSKTTHVFVRTYVQ